MKKMQQKPKGDQTIDILKRVAKRVEETTVDIGEMKRSLRFVNLRLSAVESNTGIMKVDLEKMREETNEKLMGLETRLNKRITRVADLITINLSDKLQNHEKRIKKIEQIQQSA